MHIKSRGIFLRAALVLCLSALMMAAAAGGASAVPFVGEVNMFGGNYAPENWVFCDGRTLSTTTYSKLFAVIGYTFGGSGGSFAVPDLRGRMPLGAGAGPGLTTRTVAQRGGEELVTLKESEMASHNHHAAASKSVGTTNSADQTVWASLGSYYYDNSSHGAPMAPNALSASGDSQPHYNMPPYMAINFILAVQGISP